MTVGVGPTDKLSLRVSVATLSRVTFNHPDTGDLMLALEHKAHSHSSNNPSDVFLQAQPFGGGARLLKPAAWADQLGGFHYDSQRSREEDDFRIFIDPERWPALKRRVVAEASLSNSQLLDSDPARELEEEFEETINWDLKPGQYRLHRFGFAIEDEPVPTHSWRAPGSPTARIYCLDEVTITEDNLIGSMLAASQEQTPEALLRQARQRAAAEAHGRANGLFIAPLAVIRQSFLSVEPTTRDQPMPYGGTTLSSNVVVLLERVDSPKYQRLGIG